MNIRKRCQFESTSGENGVIILYHNSYFVSLWVLFACFFFILLIFFSFSKWNDFFFIHSSYKISYVNLPVWSCMFELFRYWNFPSITELPDTSVVGGYLPTFHWHYNRLHISPMKTFMESISKRNKYFLPQFLGGGEALYLFI